MVKVTKDFFALKTTGSEYTFANKFNKAIFETADGNKYIVDMTVDEVKTACGTGSKVLMKTNSTTVYKAKTTSHIFGSAVEYDDTTAVTIGGVTYRKYAGKYIKDVDVNTYSYAGTDYLLASVNTFNISIIRKLRGDLI